MRIANALLLLAENAKEASKSLRVATTEQKNRALLAIAEELENAQEAILKANAQDLENANLPEAMRDRLSLVGRLNGVIEDVRKVATLPDPVGEIIEQRVLENGLKLQKKRVPIGVIGVIYEARPNVTVDIASLALKTGNCVILRGGKETLRTNIALMQPIHAALAKTGLPKGAIQLIESPQRSLVKQLVKLDHFIDMIIPRGGEGLHRFCREESTIPVITGGIGICHLYVDETADLERAVEVIFNAKTQRPTVCNALDTLLVHKNVAQKFLPAVVARLQTLPLSFRLDPRAWEILKAEKGEFQKANEQDWQTEWLSLILGIKVVDSLQEAIAHIQKYSTQHSDGILTNSQENAYTFVEAIDSSAVYINASTRFTDGGQFGLGAEVAVSTQKLHARGPLGLKELTTYKWIVEGNYHVRTS
jgi:glutamate-5-semialdehyde dehydrogenase